MIKLDDLTALRLFERVVVLGSITAAADVLGISLPAASKRFAKLESQLGMTLIHRSTRQLAVTDEGSMFYDHVKRIIDELNVTEEALAQQTEDIKGTLKITAPNSFGRRYLIPVLANFQRSHPDIEFQLLLSDVVQDLIAEDIDIAIRYGELPDSRLVGRRLLANKRILCASPEYLAAYGEPVQLSDLAQHRCIAISQHATLDWPFIDQAIHINHIVQSNDGEAAHMMALHGMGIVLKSYWDVYEDIQAGRLKQILANQVTLNAPISIVYLRHQHLPKRIKLFIDYLLSEIHALQNQVQR